MDHIPRSKNSAFPAISIPYLSDGYQYDQRGFHGFFERHNMSMQHVLDGNFESLSDSQIASTLQAWLYFAFLDEFIGSGIEGIPLGIRPYSHVSKSDFIQTDREARQYVTTKKLPYYLQLWHHQFSLLSPQRQRESAKQIEKSLSFVNGIAFDYLNFKNPLHATKWPLDDITVMSIIVLYQMLSSFSYNLYHGLLDAKVLQWPSSRFLNERMHELGWCDSLIRELDDSWSLDSIYFVSALKWPWPSRTHNQCTEQICLAKQVDIATYKTKHISEDCDCNFINPGEATILSIVQRGNVPVMKINLIADESTFNLDIQVQEIDISTNCYPAYVAISHVWSDGLGNSRNNALPQCQLFKLMQMVTDTGRDNGTATGDRIPFWIDTLCVPKDRAGKDLAIKSMRQVYSCASKVLVLDADIMQISFHNEAFNYQPALDSSSRKAKIEEYIYARAIEVFARLNVSSWVRRLWTLQEGAFASSLYVQFSDVSISPLTSMLPIVHREVATHQSPFSDRFEAMGLPLSKQFVSFSLLTKEDNISDRLAMISQVARSRSTSRWEDECVCLATLLGFDVGEILAADPALRMKTLLSKFDVLPGSVAFTTNSRIDEPGWRWAPTSFLGASDGLLTGEWPCKRARRGLGGLLVETVGFIRSFRPGITKDLSTFRSPSSRHGFFYGVTFDPLGSTFTSIPTATASSEAEGNAKEAAAISFLSQVAQNQHSAEIAYLLDPQHMGFIETPYTKIPGILAVITQPNNQHNHTIHVQVICSVQMLVCYSSGYHHLGAAPSQYDPADQFWEDKDLQKKLAAEQTSVDQQWCLT